tara:strand:- start:72 stop:266 length:195 start_codon:yes stop_codon:yes gene_type:complete
MMKLEYYPISRVALVLTLDECKVKCVRLNEKYSEVHFRPKHEGSGGYQIVAAKRDGSTPKLARS